MQLWPMIPCKAVVSWEKDGITHEDSVEASIYVFPVVQFLVNMLLNTNTAGGNGFLPVDLLPISQGLVSKRTTAHRFVNDRPDIPKHIQVQYAH